MQHTSVPLKDAKVLVLCFTYNQSQYIEDALNGFAMQQTKFPFVCLVMDDCSTDGEQEVIKAYLDRECDMKRAEYFEDDTTTMTLVPHRTNVNCTFAVYFLKKNLYRVQGAKAVYVNPWREHCEYEALCEGDDYWTDSYKLQKQVDFMESHPDYSMCFHKVTVKADGLDERETHFFRNLKEKEYSGREIYEDWVVPTCTVLYRKGCVNEQTDSRVVFSDIYLWLQLAEKGKLYCLGFDGAVYRRHAGSLSCQYPVQTCVKLYWQYRFFEKRFPMYKDISRFKQEDQGLKGIIYAPYFDGIWKYRVLYMFRHPKLFFSGFCTTTILSYTKFRHH